MVFSSEPYLEDEFYLCAEMTAAYVAVRKMQGRGSEIFLNGLFVRMSAVIVAGKAVINALQHSGGVIVFVYFSETVSYTRFKQI